MAAFYTSPSSQVSRQDAQGQRDLNELLRWAERRSQVLPKYSCTSHPSSTAVTPSLSRSLSSATRDTKTSRGRSLWSLLSWVAAIPSRLLFGETLAGNDTSSGRYLDS